MSKKTFEIETDHWALENGEVNLVAWNSTHPVVRSGQSITMTHDELHDLVVLACEHLAKIGYVKNDGRVAWWTHLDGDRPVYEVTPRQETWKRGQTEKCTNPHHPREPHTHDKEVL